MRHPRNFVSLTVLDGCIYAMGQSPPPSLLSHVPGGRDAQFSMERLRSVEVYMPSTNQWFPAPSMTQQRSDAAAVTLGGKIYMVGGLSDGLDENSLPSLVPTSSVEKFNPATRRWKRV